MTFRITFYGAWRKVEGATYNECDTLKTIDITASRMTKKWIIDHYGHNNNYHGVYLCKNDNPYGLTWLTNQDSLHFGDVWNICIGRKAKEKLPQYDHIIVKRIR